MNNTAPSGHFLLWALVITHPYLQPTLPCMTFHSGSDEPRLRKVFPCHFSFPAVSNTPHRRLPVNHYHPDQFQCELKLLGACVSVTWWLLKGTFEDGETQVHCQWCFTNSPQSVTESGSQQLWSLRTFTSLHFLLWCQTSCVGILCGI